MIAIVAPAKINLFLHVGPVRRDRLHDLASLFVFAATGDVVTAAPAKRLSLDITGPYADELASTPVSSNLVYRAAQALARAYGVGEGAALVLDKRLPIASGVGGGSSDAAAALLALARLWRLPAAPAQLMKIGFALGADVPACILRRSVYVGGAGEEIRRGPRLPPLWVCLVNPRVSMPTGPIFRAFDQTNPSPLSPVFPVAPPPPTYDGIARWLGAARNDLEEHATAREPIIADARDGLARQAGCLLARMSGSGATVFGLFSSGAGADRAAAAARSKGWWAASAPIL